VTSRALIVELDGVRPTIGRDVFLAPNATLIGDVHVGDRASIWFGAVLRADSAEIRVGAGTSVQDNAVLHCAEELPTVVGENVIVGHSALLEGCTIEDGAIVGMGAIALQRSRLGARAMLAAGSVLAEGAEIEPETLAAGAPAQAKKQLSGSALRWTDTAAEEYQRYRERYLRGAREVE
jgi:carbonic anhydrase/acetyltransferase-like protein (isoleucine patch superfamily)